MRLISPAVSHSASRRDARSWASRTASVMKQRLRLFDQTIPGPVHDRQEEDGLSRRGDGYDGDGGTAGGQVDPGEGRARNPLEGLCAGDVRPPTPVSGAPPWRSTGPSTASGRVTLSAGSGRSTRAT